MSLTVLARGVALAAVVVSISLTLRPGPHREVLRRLRPPNVLLVSIDSLRSDHLGAYGYERATSPTIDWLAEQGVLFEEVVSSSSWTLPAHVSLLTATPAEKHGVVKTNLKLREDAVTLAEVLKAAGYETAAFVAGPYLKSVFGYAQGFDVYDESAVREGVLSHQGVTSPQLVEKVFGFLDGREESDPTPPFFLFLHLWDVHYDYAPPPPYDTFFDPDYEGPITGNNFMLGSEYRADMAPRDIEHLIALYDGEIRYTDAHLGRIVDGLRDRGLLDDTIVVVTSDHGEEFFEHANKGHGRALYDETILVPLVIRYPPRVPAQQRIAPQIRLIDVAPTILALAGVTRPAAFGTREDAPHHARDVGPWITGDPAAGAFPLLLAYSHTAMGPDQKWAVRSSETKFVGHSRRAARPEFFDLRDDPGETRNLARKQKPGRTRALTAEAHRHRDLWEDDHFAATMKVDDSLVESLRALGYVR